MFREVKDIHELILIAFFTRRRREVEALIKLLTFRTVTNGGLDDTVGPCWPWHHPRGFDFCAEILDDLSFSECTLWPVVIGGESEYYKGTVNSQVF